MFHCGEGAGIATVLLTECDGWQWQRRLWGRNMDERVDGRQAWHIAIASLLILAVAFGSPHIVNVALKEIAAEFGGQRSIPSGANALAWLGTGIGGLAMGWAPIGSAFAGR